MAVGTMSKSAIDNMAAHDPSLLQNYANDFVGQKTSVTNQEFNLSHHLASGGSHVKHDYQSYSPIRWWTIACTASV